MNNPTPCEVAELEAKICKRYAAAFNAANKTVESGFIQVDLTDLVQDALTTAHAQGARETWGEAEEFIRSQCRKSFHSVSRPDYCRCLVNPTDIAEEFHRRATPEEGR